jgi:hypothetical protein
MGKERKFPCVLVLPENGDSRACRGLVVTLKTASYALVIDQLAVALYSFGRPIFLTNLDSSILKEIKFQN